MKGRYQLSQRCKIVSSIEALFSIHLLKKWLWVRYGCVLTWTCGISDGTMLILFDPICLPSTASQPQGFLVHRYLARRCLPACVILSTGGGMGTSLPQAAVFSILYKSYMAPRHKSLNITRSRIYLARVCPICPICPIESKKEKLGDLN